MWFRDCLGKKRRLSPALMRSPQDPQRQRHIENRVGEKLQHLEWVADSPKQSISRNA